MSTGTPYGGTPPANWTADTQSAITEFPSFSFQLGDLHPHLLALPFTILALGCCLDAGHPPRLRATARSVRAQWGRIVVAGGLVGAPLRHELVGLPGVPADLRFGRSRGGDIGLGDSRADRRRSAPAGQFNCVWAPVLHPLRISNRLIQHGVRRCGAGIPVIGGILASIAAWSGGDDAR